MESNRVGIDVDGIAQPNATGRGYVGRAGLNTFGIGRDYIDPYMYGSVDIQSGATSTETANSAIGEMSPSARNRRMITCARQDQRLRLPQRLRLCGSQLAQRGDRRRRR